MAGESGAKLGKRIGEKGNRSDKKPEMEGFVITDAFV